LILNRYLIIPDIKDIGEYLELAEKYDFGFEFNDFYTPVMLTDKKACCERIEEYQKYDLPDLLTTHGDFFDVLVFSSDKEIADISVKRIYESMDTALRLGAKKIVFHTNINSAIDKEFYFNHWVDSNEKVFKEVCKKYPDITVLLENMFDHDPRALLAISERMKDVDNFGVCLDYAHAFLSKEDVSEWARKLSPYIKHVHINDNDGRYDLHLPVGEGRIDWDIFDKNRREYFPDVTILLEVNGIDKIKRSIETLHIS